MSNKQIVVIQPDGSERILDKFPTYDEMKSIVGGWIERVRVLEHGSLAEYPWRYTVMIVNEEGLLLNLPRNEKATELYQRNVLAQFPRDNKRASFIAAEVANKAQLERLGAVVIVAPPPPGSDPYDPHIAGSVIYFRGYTEQEVDAEMNKDLDDC